VIRKNFSRCFASISCLTVLLVFEAVSIGNAAPTITPNIPDFYQHQFWDALPAGGRVGWENVAQGGWCRYTAIADALYPWKVQPAYTNLLKPNVDITGQWLGAASDAVAEIENTYNSSGLGAINNYLTMKGVGPSAAITNQPSLLAMKYQIDPITGNVFVALSNHRLELVTKGGANYSGFDFYKDQTLEGRSSVLTFNATVPKQNNLWWWGSFHAVAGAGYDAGNRSILFTDPDSNKGNNASNAGWWNLVNGGPNDGRWDTSVAGTAAAVTRVQGNLYTAADGTKDPPLPGNTNGLGAAYTISDLYGTVKLNADGYTIGSSDKGLLEGGTGRYTGVRLSKIETISPTLSSITGAIQLGINKFKTTFNLTGDLSSKVDEIKVFPDQALADNSFSFDQPNWTESMTATDPFGYARPLGGEDIHADAGEFFDPGEDGNVTLDTTSTFANYDIYLHDSLTDEWLVQPTGGDPNLDTFQTQAPEPSSCLLMLSGVILGGLYKRTRRRQESASSAW
jgi:hypothetical protein